MTFSNEKIWKRQGLVDEFLLSKISKQNRHLGPCDFVNHKNRLKNPKTGKFCT